MSLHVSFVDDNGDGGSAENPMLCVGSVRIPAKGLQLLYRTQKDRAPIESIKIIWSLYRREGFDLKEAKDVYDYIRVMNQIKMI